MSLVTVCSYVVYTLRDIFGSQDSKKIKCLKASGDFTGWDDAMSSSSSSSSSTHHEQFLTFSFLH